MAPPNGGQGDRGLASVRGDVLTTPLPTAAAGGGGLHATGHDPGDGPQLQSLQAEQAPDPEGSPHDGEAGEAAEDRAGAEAKAEAPGTRAHHAAGPSEPLGDGPLWAAGTSQRGSQAVRTHRLIDETTGPAER